MPDVVIDNPIINSPYVEPTRHFRFSEDGITDEIEDSRRQSAYFVPIPPAKRKSSKQLLLEDEETESRHRENEFINAVRGKVERWRRNGHPHVTPTTHRLLDYWTDPERENKLFFCQIEAVETAIYLLEAAPHDQGQRFDDILREHGETYNPGLFRIAHKMATGTGKTVVMAMLIAWHTLNCAAQPRDNRFTDQFLVVTPGITIRDRLRVLLPSDPNDYYRERDLVPADELTRLHRADIIITNFHGFLQRETVSTTKLTKTVLKADFKESPEEMVNRVCGNLGKKRQIVVLNDEAHHCYVPRPPGDDSDDGAETAPKYTGAARKEAEENTRNARVWADGLRHVGAKVGIKCTYDLSATPFFLAGSGYPEGDLFPWVVSDFALIDAIESGIVKVPRVPVADDAIDPKQPAYRELWPRIRGALPRRAKELLGGEPNLPKELEGALHSLYGNYAKSFEQWEERPWGKQAGEPPPVFIVVCQNTAISKLVFDYIAGWAKPLGGDEHGGEDEESEVLVHGKVDLFDNVEDHGAESVDRRWADRPPTILIDSRQLESGEAMSREFKQLAAREIAEFKHEIRQRFPGSDPEAVSDEQLLREVMNTVGKPGRLGEHVRCVVSVSMLTEGWDANTVTHILGVRAFGTQLLCEQVVGRGLRRRSYVANDEGMFDPEYAEVYGVPFSFIPTSGATAEPRPAKPKFRVRAVEDRADLAITFPRVLAYRYELPETRLVADFSDQQPLVISTREMPSKTEVTGIVGGEEIHDLATIEAQRPQTVAFELASEVLRIFTAGKGDKPFLFPQVLRVTREWMADSDCLQLRDNVALQWLLLSEWRHRAAEKIVGGIVQAGERDEIIKAVLQEKDSVGSTADVDFETTRDVIPTRPDKSHVSHVVLDSGWEETVAHAIEALDNVRAYVRNDHLRFTIPYTHEGDERRYTPDFLVSVEVDEGERPATVVVEVSGEKREDKQAKVAAARELWIPAVNRHRGFGRWWFIEIDDPTDVRGPLSAAIETVRSLP